MRVLALTRYGRLGASSRVRFLQYLPYLKSVGIDVEVSCFLGDRYQRLFQASGYKSSLEAVRGYARRTLALLRSKSFDLVWIEKDALPWMPALIEHVLLPGNRPYVLDYDDAVFHYYDQHRSALTRRLLADKHDQIMRNAALVIAGNPYIAERAVRAGAPTIEIVPTVVDTGQYVAEPVDEHGTVTIGWIGQPHNAQYLRLMGLAIKQVSATEKVKFVAVGARDRIDDFPVDPRPWSEATEVDEIRRFSIGIMPLPDEPFERGKCGYKLIQYMACGKPVVASPVGVNRDIVEHGVNGFLAETAQEWEEALRTLARDPQLRARMGSAGRRKIEGQYSLQCAAPRLAKLFLETVRPWRRASLMRQGSSR